MIEDGEDRYLLQVASFHAICSRTDGDGDFRENGMQFGAGEYVLCSQRPTRGDQLINSAGDRVFVIIEMFGRRGGLDRWGWRQSSAKVKLSVLAADFRIQKLALNANIGA